jgi:hypothetical protein
LPNVNCSSSGSLPITTAWFPCTSTQPWETSPWNTLRDGVEPYVSATIVPLGCPPPTSLVADTCSLDGPGSPNWDRSCVLLPLTPKVAAAALNL